eukprot:11977048-Alexandrium_andersonii.AAC.1
MRSPDRVSPTSATAPAAPPVQGSKEPSVHAVMRTSGCPAVVGRSDSASLETACMLSPASSAKERA